MKAIHRIVLSAGLVSALVGLGGCGWVIDKDRIVVARIGDRAVTRGELARVIRDMPDDERPIIENRGDLLLVLESYLDNEIRNSEAEKLEAEGKIKLPRELAVQEFDALHPEYKGMENMQNPEEYNLSKAHLVAMQDEREAGIDRVHKRNLGRVAVLYRAQEAVKDGSLTITPEELKEEYNLRGDEFRSFEQIVFTGLQFRGDENAARAEAAKVIQRTQAGEAFEDIQAEYRAKNPDMVIAEAAIENNPAVEKFRGFWQQASGAEPGQILGPIFLPPSDRVNPATGAVERTGGGILVLKVVQHTPDRQKSLEEAAEQLAQPILETKMMERLRQEYGVEVYRDKLPDPSFAKEQDPLA